MFKAKHVYKLRPDGYDPRDFKLKFTRQIALPDEHDNRHWCSPVRDQKDLGSCSSFSSAGGAFEMIENKIFIEKLPLAQYTEDFGPAFKQVSTMFQYQNTLILEGCFGQDNGATIRGAVKALATYGVCPEAMWPYDTKNFAVRAPKEVYAEAAKHRISMYAKLSTQRDIMQAVVQGLPVVIGIMLYESFESDVVAKNGVVPMPDIKREQLLGGHAVCIVGYTKTHYIIRNSWGPDWGDKGYFYLPKAYLDKLNQEDGLAMDPWCITK